MSILFSVDQAAVHSSSTTLVEPVSLALVAGRPFTILGETGSGKSLLAQALMGLLPHGLNATGSALIDGLPIDLTDPGAQRPLFGRKVGVLPQEPWLALDPTMRALPQVAEGHRFIAGKPTRLANEAAREDLLALDVADCADKLPMQLSGGMAQRVAFAAARAGGARIIIADEPTKGLDVARRNEVIALLMREVKAGGTILTITHDLELARQMGGDLAVMFEGRIIEQGLAEEVLDNPSHTYTRRLIAADPKQWPQQKRHADQSSPIILEAKDIEKTRGGKRLFTGIDLTLRRGEILGVTGQSGSGKSSLGDILLGLLPPDRGRVLRDKAIAKVRYQKIYQDPPSAFPARVTLAQSLNDLTRLHRLDAQRIAPLMQRLRLSPTLLSRLPGEVSGGELQRFALLRVLMLDPVFLFADEPTSRLDVITQAETIQLLVELAREQGCAVLIVSHDRALIDKTCDRQLAISA
ncbi:ATP-binding cassette domain-containing protein [Rhizobium sp. FY34]|uniref:ABC transporter ATP-binding protein n=1 Tax=Rhizobium sp. FY34 TaxID=2562309 RepID=UPI0010C1268D|nr:ATP-binding cassette domain-containing protein [Rhizobium sp. FY34]